MPTRLFALALALVFEGNPLFRFLAAPLPSFYVPVGFLSLFSVPHSGTSARIDYRLSIIDYIDEREQKRFPINQHLYAEGENVKMAEYESSIATTSKSESSKKQAHEFVPTVERTYGLYLRSFITGGLSSGLDKRRVSLIPIHSVCDRSLK